MPEKPSNLSATIVSTLMTALRANLEQPPDGYPCVRVSFRFAGDANTFCEAVRELIQIVFDSTGGSL